ncbi:MAG: hypothetical protein M1839_001965 [Geoglossum umbratile]|nr:MAG: hypothetical protein M1839_001965 [Geoglossum umbratile]
MLERRAPSSRAEFLASTPIVTEDVTQFTNLKTTQLWAFRATEFGSAFLKHNGKKLFWKTMKSKKLFFAELDGYRLLHPFFRSEQLQRPVGIDPSTQRIFYDFLEGASTVWELYLSFLTLEARMAGQDDTGLEHTAKVILDIESRRNRAILKAYKDSILFSTSNTINAEDRGTSVMDGFLGAFVSDYKLSLDLRFPTGIPAGECGCTIDEYFSYNFIINNCEYSNLDNYTSIVTRTLSSALNNTILAAGLGDGRFGNLMIDAPDIGTALHFID